MTSTRADDREELVSRRGGIQDPGGKDRAAAGGKDPYYTIFNWRRQLQVAAGGRSPTMKDPEDL